MDNDLHVFRKHLTVLFTEGKLLSENCNTSALNVYTMPIMVAILHV